MKYIIFSLILIDLVITYINNLKIKNLAMASKEQFQAVIQQIDVATSAIAQRIRNLEDTVKSLGLAGSEEEAILSQIQGVAAQLEEIGKEPIPEDSTTTETTQEDSTTTETTVEDTTTETTTPVDNPVVDETTEA